MILKCNVATEFIVSDFTRILPATVPPSHLPLKAAVFHNTIVVVVVVETAAKYHTASCCCWGGMGGKLNLQEAPNL